MQMNLQSKFEADTQSFLSSISRKSYSQNINHLQKSFKITYENVFIKKEWYRNNDFIEKSIDALNF